jgi:hypothetical protein
LSWTINAGIQNNHIELVTIINQNANAILDRFN